MLLGLGFAALGAGTVISLGADKRANQMDPLLWPGILLNVLLWVPLAVVTGFVGWKQWCYYYGNPFGNGSPKDGIFVNAIRQANIRETIMDVVLSINGGALIGMIFLPSYWFLTFAVYCLVIILRCWFTLRRPKYAVKARAEGDDVPAFIDSAVDAKYNGLLVKAVLAGWIASDLLYFAYCVIAAVLCLTIFSGFGSLWKFLCFAVAVAVFFVLFLGVVKRHSHSWGLWLLRKTGMLALKEDG